MSKEIKITPDLFSLKKTKKPNRNLKKELLQTISTKESNVLTELESLTNGKEKETEETEKEKGPEYGCLKNGEKPTYRQLKTKTVKQYSMFGKNKQTVRVLIKDKDTYARIEKEKKKLEKHSMIDIRNYLRTRKLYKIGSTAPDEVLREIYINANLAGNVENNNSDTLVHNYLAE
jgi:hypothetical protein